MLNVKVMLVDENPMILRMLQQAVGAFAIVTTETDAGDAMLRAIDDPPDLIISDYQMPGMDGRQLLQKLKGRPNTARVPIILMAGRTDIAERLKMVSDQVEDFVEKPFFIKEAAARIKKVVDKIALEKMAKEAPSEGVVRGSLAQMNVMDLLQSLEMGHKSCLLTLSFQGDKCEMYFSDGQINHATYGTLKGDEAVYKVMAWTGGTFQIDFNGASTEKTITRSTQGLLMEGLRLLDEANRDAEANVLEA